MNGVVDRARHDSVDRPWRGKRSTLDGLRPHLQRSRIPSGFGIGLARWSAQRDSVLDLIAGRFGGALLAVRSDRADEDAMGASGAGRYRTCLDVRASDRDAVADAVDAVFASYAHARSIDEVFVQQQVVAVRDAAVAFTHALPDGAPYYVLSIARGPRSDHVTRGDTDVDTWYFAREGLRIDTLTLQCRAYLDALREIESVVGTQPCEVEMVTDEANTIWLLQARPLAAPRCDEAAVIVLRRKIESNLSALSPQPPLLGIMPDWNPAELLGEHPRPLARELFDTLITRRAWRIGRAVLGYARTPAVGLLQFHAGRPYVDARSSFRSLLPAGLDADVGERLMTAHCERLRAHPEYHDKIEFDVAFTVLTCRMRAAFAARYPSVLDDAELALFEHALRRPTLAALDATLTDRLLEGFARDLHLPPLKVEPARLRHRLQRLELRTGVRFAVAARQAFALEALLQSAVEAGALDEACWRAFKQVAARDAAATAMHIDDGHVRAGTFDIAAPARREFAAHASAPAPTHDDDATASRPIDDAAARGLHDALRELGLEITPDALLAHYRRVLHARELGKFVLARGVSHALDALAALARARDVDRDEAGWLSLADLLDPALDRCMLRERIERARAAHAVEARLRMPLLIRDVQLDTIHHAPGHANWLGRGRVDDVPTTVDAHTHPDSVPLHAIIAIASANPGFDWIFLRRPAALLTAFGGPNSHMAIRCAEAGVPALLGVGPEAFRRATSAARIRIDFEARTWTTA
jgi:hypothetical protein